MRLAIIVSFTGAAFFGGWRSAQDSIKSGARADSFITNGVWFTSRYVGAMDADAKTRAFVATSGLLGLSRKETIYYRAHTDQNGDPISSQFDYELVGEALPARWWSLTLYDHDHFLNPDVTGPYSAKSTTIQLDANGGFRIMLSAQPSEGNWIDMGDGREMSLSLRMYNPDPSVIDDFSMIALPTISRIDLAGERFVQ